MDRNLFSKLIGGLMVAATASSEANFDAGMRAYKNLDFETARYEWVIDALAGHSVAQYYLGEIYGGGYGVTADAIKAIDWYKRSAANNYAPAQTRLGWIYAQGGGVQVNDLESFKWYSSAAELGDTEAQYQLGFYYRDGRGTVVNNILAYKWWSIAALWGDPDAGALRDKLVVKMESQQIETSRELVQQWEARYYQ